MEFYEWFFANCHKKGVAPSVVANACGVSAASASGVEKRRFAKDANPTPNRKVFWREIRR